ncbi:MAG TPA: hypothetical protein VL742_16445 [Casimicrobiaceae bacterium]|nr:hypothetical protein [Casimicrobiaceae bacterium]
MTFNAQFVDQALLVYTVNRVTVAKTIHRQNLVTLDFNGVFTGTLAQTGIGGAACGAADNNPAAPASIGITQSGPSMAVTIRTDADTCTFPGSYSQGGHFGQVEGSYSCTSGDSGTFSISEMAVSWYDFRARTVFTSNGGCLIKGYVDGLRQPPPAQ